MANRAAQPDPRSLHIVIRMDGGDPPTGEADAHIEDADGRAVGASGVRASARFSGWLGLLSALSSLIRAVRAASDNATEGGAR